MTDGRLNRRTSLPTAGLITLAGLAIGLGTADRADAISFVKLRSNHSAWNSVAVPERDMDGNIIWTDIDGDGHRDTFETQTVFQAITGQGVTVGMIEPAHPLINTDPNDPNAAFEHHIAFDGLDHRRIWYPFETRNSTNVSLVRRQIAPRDPQGFLLFPTSHHQHATAVAGAICARNTALEGGIGSIGPVTGIAPNVQLLSGSLITSTDPADPILGAEQGLTLEAFLFTLAAMTDLDYTGDGEGDYIAPLADWYGVEPWEPATVINISFGRVRSIDQRAGEDAFARICDIISRKTGTVIIAAAGDEGQNGMIDEEEDETGRIASPASAHNVIAVGRTGSTDNQDDVDEDSSFGPQVRFNWVHMDLDGNLYLQVPPTPGNEDLEGTDYGDINFLEGQDPRDPEMQTSQLFPDDNASNPDGVRPGIDIVAPGTMIELPGNLTLPQGQLGLTSTWSDFEGTSFATAIVTGAVALMQEYGNAWEYSIDPLVMRAVLLNSAEKPQSWDNGSRPDNVNDFSSSTDQGLDEFLGAGILDFERLLLQYRTTPGGYPDLGPANTEIIRNSIFPLYRRDPGIGGDPGSPDFVEGPNSGEFGTVDFTPVVPSLRNESRYLESFVNSSGIDTARAYLYTDPDIAMVTFYNDPTATSTAVIAPRTTTPTDESAPSLPPSSGDDGGFRSYSAQPVSGDRYGFDDLGGPGSGGSTGRISGIGGGNTGGGRTGTGGSGTTAPPRPGGLGGDGNGGGGTSPSGLRPCTSVAESRCVRTGWDIGRLGVGTILLPIGGVPQNSDITATLVWHRIEEIDDSVYETLLDGVLTATPPAPPVIQDLARTDDASVQAELIDAATYGPAPLDAYTRTATTWPSERANYTTYPLVMAGETHLGPAPGFADEDKDRDGVIDFMGALQNDNCFIDMIPNPAFVEGGDEPEFLPVPLNNIGTPRFLSDDSYNPEQTDGDGDGCGPPCDTDDGAPSMELFCETLGTGTPDTTTDSERLRRVATDYFNTAKDTLNIDPLALSGVVAITHNRGNGEYDMATGVLIDQQRILTSAHLFDQDNDGLRDPGSFTVAFSPMKRGDDFARRLIGLTISEVAIHPSFNYNGDRVLDGFDPVNIIENGADDLAIITYTGGTFSEFIDLTNGFAPGTFPYSGADLQIYPIVRTPPPSLDDSQEIIIAGYGESGDGRYGVPVDTSTETPPPGFVPAGFNFSGPPVPVLRAGKNVIEFYPFDNDDDDIGNPDAPVEQFGFDFDPPSSAASLGNRIESMITFGDSGGPAFIHNDINLDGNVDLGELNLFGINTRMNVPAGATELSTFGSRGLGMVLDGYTGFDDDGNFRFIDAILSDAPPQQPETIGFGGARSAHFDLTTAFKFDNLSLSLFRDTTVGGSGFSPVPTATSASINNVEHFFAENVRAGQYVIAISWDGPVFDWSGFLAAGPTPFRKVPPVPLPAPAMGLDPEDLIDFFPSEVKYGLAWWADLEYDLPFEQQAAGARTLGQLHGDLNADMSVNADDLAVLLSSWGSDDWNCDIDDSGVVDMSDLSILLLNYQR